MMAFIFPAFYVSLHSLSMTNNISLLYNLQATYLARLCFRPHLWSTHRPVAGAHQQGAMVNGPRHFGRRLAQWHSNLQPEHSQRLTLEWASPGQPQTLPWELEQREISFLSKMSKLIYFVHNRHKMFTYTQYGKKHDVFFIEHHRTMNYFSTSSFPRPEHFLF